jgi:hypothetical protein
MKNLLLCALAVLAAAASFPSMAQPADGGTPLRLRGTVRAFQGGVLVVTSGNDSVEFAVPPTVGINGVVRRSLEDIVDGVFVGITAGPTADGGWQATEVHIFPEEMRGAGEGHYAWDLPETTMTNATVTGTASAGDGRALKLSHVDGETEIDVGPQAEIVALVPGDTSLLIPGAAVFVLGSVDDSGAFSAIAIVAEKGGVRPPM